MLPIGAIEASANKSCSTERDLASRMRLVELDTTLYVERLRCELPDRSIELFWGAKPVAAIAKRKSAQAIFPGKSLADGV